MTTNPAPAVVGVDGSPQSLTAADWAAREAVARQCPLRIVHALPWPPLDVPVGPPTAPPPDPGLQHAAEQVLAGAAEAVRHRRRASAHRTLRWRRRQANLVALGRHRWPHRAAAHKQRRRRLPTPGNITTATAVDKAPHAGIRVVPPCSAHHTEERGPTGGVVPSATLPVFGNQGAAKLADRDERGGVVGRRILVPAQSGMS
jgi:nucleotide-binding universal stress UspA family protein